MKRSLLLLPMLLLATTLSAHTTDQQDPHPKRPATAEECDPSSWVTDPDVDYSFCEEGATHPRQ